MYRFSFSMLSQAVVPYSSSLPSCSTWKSMLLLPSITYSSFNSLIFHANPSLLSNCQD